MLDHVAQEIAPQLYTEGDPRILDKDAEIQYENGVVRVVSVNENLSVISLAPEGITPENAKGIVTFQSGYTTPPTSLLTDAFAKPLLEHLAEIESIAVFWAPYGRGTENAINNQGRWSAEKIRRHIAEQLKEIFEHFGPDGKKWLGGHSMGGQMNLNIFGNPWQYDFNHKSFDGALAYCPVSLPYSQMIMLRKDGLNVPIFNDLVPKGLVPVLKALLTGKGVELGEEKGEKFFFSEPLVGMEEVTRRLFPDSGLYFLQTINPFRGSSLPDIKYMLGKRIGLMDSTDDRIVTDVAMEHTNDSLLWKGANVRRESVRGDHFSAFYKSPDSDPREIIQKHKKLFDHVLRLD